MLCESVKRSEFISYEDWRYTQIIHCYYYYLYYYYYNSMVSSDPGFKVAEAVSLFKNKT